MGKCIIMREIPQQERPCYMETDDYTLSFVVKPWEAKIFKTRRRAKDYVKVLRGLDSKEAVHTVISADHVHGALAAKKFGF